MPKKSKRACKKNKASKEIRADGYVNMLNKYGTSKDSSEQYSFSPDNPTDDIELTMHYEFDGLFAKIIDTPADEALRHGFKLNIKENESEMFIMDSLEELGWDEKAATAIKWARLYGGSMIVMLADDGGGLEDPLNWDAIKGVEDLLIFERPYISPDYSSVYQCRPGDRQNASKFGLPEYYDISSPYGGVFRVHESRCLIFRNSTLPQMLTQTQYRFFGLPELCRIRRELKNTHTAHGNGVRLLDRCVQAIYKMKNLAQLMSTEEGEDDIVKRLNLIDMAKGIMNTIAIDGEGEDYDFRNITLTGAKDIIDTTCNMLSAVTNIPQTKLFGRSPAGENSTGDSDLENYYDYVGGIQTQMLKNNQKTLLDAIIVSGQKKGICRQAPKYKLEFNPLWNLTEAQQAEIDSKKADTEKKKAETAKAYVDMQAIIPEEVRKTLAVAGEFTIGEAVEEDDWTVDVPYEGETQAESFETAGTALTGKAKADEREFLERNDGEDIAHGVGVLIIKAGKFLVAERTDGRGLCGPGGHMEDGESPLEAAVRETAEEFGIIPKRPVFVASMPETAQSLPTELFLCTEFAGEPVADGVEMKNAKWMSQEELAQEPLFPAFENSVAMFVNELLHVEAGH